VALTPDGSYLQLDSLQGGEAQKTFTRRIQDKDVTFEVVDSTIYFSEQDWNRVVAFFVSGENYQLKDYLDLKNEKG
jgi:hypothetical protein